MTVAVKVDGAQTATIATEHVLATITDAGIYQLIVDANNMTGGATPDILELRYYGKARISNGEQLEEVHTFIGLQTSPLLRCKPVISPHYLKVTLRQMQGTGKIFHWAIYQT